MAKEVKKIKVHIVIEPYLLARLDAQAKKEHRTRSNLVQKILLELLD